MTPPCRQRAVTQKRPPPPGQTNPSAKRLHQGRDVRSKGIDQREGAESVPTLPLPVLVRRDFDLLFPKTFESFGLDLPVRTFFSLAKTPFFFCCCEDMGRGPDSAVRTPWPLRVDEDPGEGLLVVGTGGGGLVGGDVPFRTGEGRLDFWSPVSENSISQGDWGVAGLMGGVGGGVGELEGDGVIYVANSRGGDRLGAFCQSKKLSSGCWELEAPPVGALFSRVRKRCSRTARLVERPVEA